MPDEKLIQISFDGIAVGDIKLPAADITVPETVVPQVKSLIQGTYDAASALGEALNDNAELEAKYDELETAIEEVRKKLDSAEKLGPEELKTAVSSRLKLERTAAFFKVDKFDELDDMALMKGVIAKKHGADILKSDKMDTETDTGKVYIRARFDILVEEAEKGGKGLNELIALQRLTTPKMDSEFNFDPNVNTGATDPASLREKFMNESRNAFRDPKGVKAAALKNQPGMGGANFQPQV